MKALEAFGVGLAITVALTLAAAGLELGPTTDLETWGRNALFSVVASCSAYVVNHLRTIQRPPV
jgi:hypothetical protein